MEFNTKTFNKLETQKIIRNRFDSLFKPAFIFLLAIYFCFKAAIPLSAATFYWVGGASGEWGTASNWSTTEGGAGGSVVPGGSDTVVFTKDVTIEDAVQDGGGKSGVGQIEAENANLIFSSDIYVRGRTLKVNSLQVAGDCQYLSNAANVETSGNQVYSSNVSVRGYSASGNDSDRKLTFKSTAGTITFASTVASWNDVHIPNVEIDGNVVFEGAVGGTSGFGSLSVSGVAVIKTSVKTVSSYGSETGTGAQTYSGALTLAGDVSITADTVSFGSTVDSDSDTTARSLAITGNAEFSGAVGGTNLLSSLSVTGTTTTSTDVSFNAGSGTLTFTGAFSGSATINSPAVFSAGNTFTNLTVGSGTQTFDITITFAGGTTQTVSGTLSCKGTSAHYVTLTSGGTWTYSGAASAGNFDYTYIENSAASMALSITPSTKHLSEKTAASTTNWFAFKYYWIGAASTSWSEPTNWAIDEDGTIPLESDENAPSSTDGMSEITILKGVSKTASPYMLTFSADASIKSLTVNENATVDFADKNLTCSETIHNSGTIRISGHILLNFSSYPDNSADSTIEYYKGSVDEFDAIYGVAGYNNLSVTGVKVKFLQSSGGASQSVAVGTNLTVSEGGSIDSAELSVTGTTSFSGDSSVTTTGAQNYAGNVDFGSGEVTLTAEDSLSTFSEIKFGNSVTGSGKLKLNGIAASSGGTLSFSTSSSASSAAEVDFEQGFASGVDVAFQCSATIKSSNSFASLSVGDGSQNFPIEVQFEAGKTQTIGSISSSGASSTNTVQLKSTTDGSEWKACFSSIPSDSDFSYTIVRDSHSVDSSGTDNDLNLIPSATTVLDWQPSNLTCACWFSYKYYWTGAVDSNWENAANWSCSDADGAAAAPGYPAFTGGTSEITVLKGSSTTASPYILTLTDNVNIKSFTVNENATVDFATYDFTATSTGTNPLVNNGTVRIGGNVTVTAASVENGDDSAVEYYGSSLTQLGWGSSYQNLEFSAGASCASSTAMTVSGTLKIYNGDGNEISLAGANVFSNPVEIGSSVDSLVQAGNVTLNAASGLEIASGANCTSLDVKCGATLGSVESTGTGTSQLYEGAVTLSENSSFTGVNGTLVHFKKPVTGGSKSLTVSGSNVEFDADVSGTSTILVENGTTTLAKSAGTQNISSSGAQVYGGAVLLSGAGEKSLSASNGDVALHGVTDSGTNKFTVTAVSFINLYAENYTTNGIQTYKSDVKLLADSSSSSGTWSAGGTVITCSKNLYMDFGSVSMILDSNLSAKNIYFYCGNLTVSSGKTLSTTDDFAVWGSNYNATDPRFSTSNTRFAFYGADSLSYLKTSGFSASFSATGATLSAGQNFYLNGADLSGCALTVPDNSSSHPVFNSTGAVTQKQWGSPYAVCLNSTVTNVTVSDGWLTAGGTDSETSGATQGCTDGGGNSNVQFDVPHIKKAYSVSDNVLYVEFDMKIENSNGEIAENLLNVKYSGGSTAFAGVYTTAACTTALSSSAGDVTSFYLKASSAGKWNTDATGTSLGSDDSTDRSGTHRELKTDLTFLEGVFTAANGHTMCRNYNAGLENGSKPDAYTLTEDKAKPVLIKTYIGQEEHKASGSQEMFDSHNFIEFVYSEPVNVGSLAYDGGDVNVQATSTLGAIKNNSSGFTVASLGTFASGSVLAGIKTLGASGAWSGTLSEAEPHSLYRKFSTTVGGTSQNQPCRVRVSVAGFVDESSPVVVNGTSFNNWVGYIDSAESPALGSLVTPVASSLVVDLAGNAIDASVKPNLNAASDGLYGSWDVSGPIFAPFIKNKSEWDSWFSSGDSEYYEIIGSVESNSSAYLERIEFHLFDNAKDQYSSRYWLVASGWWNGSSLESDAPESLGGSKPFDSTNATVGGIRRSSLDGAASAFTYEILKSSLGTRTFGSGTITQNVKSALFRHVDKNSTQTEDDGLYFGIPLNASDAALPMRTTFNISFSSENSFITDLAGNRIKEDLTMKSVDVTPPSISMTLSPIGDGKIYVVFNKALSYGGSYLREISSNATLYSDFREKFCSEFFLTSDSPDEVASPSDSGIAITDVEIKGGSDDFTALLLTLDHSVTLDDVEKMYLMIKYNEDSEHYRENLFGVSGYYSLVQDYLGNSIDYPSCHAISDFALNAVNVIYAYADESSNENWHGNGSEGESSDSYDYIARDFSANAGNYGRLRIGRDVVLQVQFVGGKDDSGYFVPVNGETICLQADKKANLSSSMVSNIYNEQTGSSWRIWLPTALTSLASSPSGSAANFAAESCESAGDDDSLLWNFRLENSKYNFAVGDELQFVFEVKDSAGSAITIDHDGDSSTDRVPLYALWMPSSTMNSGDYSFADLWSLSFSDVKSQRGGVSILNNVIDVNSKESAIIQVELPAAGNLNVYVMTLDGNIVRQLSKGRVNAGTHTFKWNGTNKNGKSVARGMYFVRVTGSGIDETRKVMCVRER
ncbi:FlgD immunoglobulin-like domain containing protein [Treponema zioleckii]|uniref:FlgD immunoglobulin-like domain containing protein n=1 Tax=Treponema zioleckii TaxID=331680 RepID=UPI00168ACF64|nr:FlgD immunoglobulin-like domain containing protein [Treponema zioleckii]